MSVAEFDAFHGPLPVFPVEPLIVDLFERGVIRRREPPEPFRRKPKAVARGRECPDAAEFVDYCVGSFSACVASCSAGACGFFGLSTIAPAARPPPSTALT